MKIPERTKEVQEWAAEGHEILGQHPGLDHGNWDGCTNFSQEYALSYRQNRSRAQRVIEQGILPVKTIPEAQFTALQGFQPRNGTQNAKPGTGNKLCGDGACDSVELANPDLCPSDCG